MRHIAIALAVSAFALGGCGGGDELLLRSAKYDLTNGIPGALQVGDILINYGMEITVPHPGNGLWSEVIAADGTHHEVLVQTSESGEVEVKLPEQIPGEIAYACPAKCTDATYSYSGFPYKLGNAVQTNFYYNTANTGTCASKVSVDAAAAAHAWWWPDNACGYSVWGPAPYLHANGTTTRAASLAANCSDSAKDGYNVIDHADIANGALGTACVSYSNGAFIEGDMRVNTRDFVLFCSGDPVSTSQYSLKATYTHEMGHWIGMAHVDTVSSPSHCNLTMTALSYKGQTGLDHAILGKGDVLGMENKYK